MNSRQRVLAALEHRQPDRTPIDIGGSVVSTLIQGPYEQLKDLLGIESKTELLSMKAGNVFLDERVAERLHADTRPLAVGSPDSWEDQILYDGSLLDEFQVVWRKAGDGHYAPVEAPIKDATLSALDAYTWPDPLDPGRTRGLNEAARRLNQDTDYAVVLSLPAGFIHLSQYLRGYQDWLMDTILNREFLEDLMDRTVDYWIRLVDSILDEVEPYVDVVLLADDVAFQDRPMLDIDTYRRIIKPRHHRMVAAIKSKSRARIVYHTDGVILPYINDFIEIGFDALNPIQVNCPGMGDTAALKKKFGERISFWGGIDTNSILPHGSPQDVRDEVRRRINDFGTDGGYILAAVHNIQEGVPPENIVAMADTAIEYG